MVLGPSFPTPTSTSSFPISSSHLQSARALAGLIVRDAAGSARAGVLPRHTNALVTARSDGMTVDVAAFEAVTVRGGVPILLPNDGSTNVAVGQAPAANKRIDLVYAKQNQAAAPYGDANNNQVFGYVSSDVAATPSLSQAISRLPVGALPLAAVTIPAGATNTASSSPLVTVDQVFPYTATTGGVVHLRSQAEQDAWQPLDGSLAHRIDLGYGLVRGGGVWRRAFGDTGWKTLVLQNGWTNMGGAYMTSQYRCLNGRVEVEGWLQPGNVNPAQVVAQLDVGFRPSAYIIRTVWSNGQARPLEIAPNGNIVIGDTSANNRLSLGFSFVAEQ